MNQEVSDLKKYPPIHFIIGPGRSGTTLLMMLLNHTNGVIATPEVKHVLFLKDRVKIPPTKLVNLRPVVDFFSIIKKSVSNPLNQFDIELLEKDLSSIHVENYPDFAKQVHLSLHQKSASETTVIIDKNNLYTFYVKELLQLYPDAKFCVSIRDYRGFVASNMKSQHQFKEKKSVIFFAEVWNCYVRKINLLKKELGNRIYILRYEDFVKEPENELKNLAHFLDFTFDSNCFDYTEHIKDTVNEYKKTANPDPRILKKIEDLTKPIHAGSIDSWKKGLTSHEIQQTELLSKHLGIQFGYEPTQHFHATRRFFFLLITFPVRLRVKLFFALRSLKIHHYLNVVKRSVYNKEKGFSS
jgi:hypothetical protein